MLAPLVDKALASGAIVLRILWIAKSNPQLAGWLTAMPLITALTVFWLLVDGRSEAVLTQYLTGVLIGVGHTALLMCVVLLRLKSGAPFGAAVAAGTSAWALTAILIYQARLFP